MQMFEELSPGLSEQNPSGGSSQNSQPTGWQQTARKIPATVQPNGLGFG
jgi:hypothetical protein